jgi:hypothetical protein
MGLNVQTKSSPMPFLGKETKMNSTSTASATINATVISVKYAIVPNTLIFAMFFGLILHAYLTKNLNFSLKDIAPADLLFGILGLVFGFWYLHWVETPIWLNALLYSPLGAVNCPTAVYF